MQFSLTGTPTQIIAQLDAMIEMPTYATPGAAAVDLRAGEDAIVWNGESTLVNTGIRVKVPDGYALLIYPRSGLAAKYGVRLANGVGVVDSDYTGYLMVALTRDHPDDGGFVIKKGDRIAQAVLQKVERIEFVVGEMPTTERGAGGFGSTGLA